MTSNLAPILIFTYKRLDTLKCTIDALKKNHFAENSKVFIFSDGARDEGDKRLVQDVRDYLPTIEGFLSVTIFESFENKGLAKSIIGGVSKMFETCESVIVVEDDLITSTNFISYMNATLRNFQHQPKVFSIAGYSFNLATKPSEYEYDAYFVTRGWPWGWATWKDRWVNIDWEVKDYEQFKLDAKAKKEFAQGGSDLNAMLQKQMEGQLDSWAIRWFYHQYKIKGLTLYPLFSKIHNIGFDEFATHTKGSDKRYIPNMDSLGKHKFNFPLKIEKDPVFQKKFQSKMSVKRRIWGKVETLIIKLF